MNGPWGVEINQTLVHTLSDIAIQSDLDQQLSRLVELAQKSVGFGEAAVWTVTSNGDPGLRACTNASLHKALTSLTKVVPSPVEDCLTHQSAVEIDQFGTDSRWATFTTELSDKCAIGSALSYFLGSPSRPVGVLMFFASQPFDDESRHTAALFAGLSAHTLDAAIQADKARHLELALTSNRHIGIAIGIVMALQRVDKTAAFTSLREASQRRHCKLREIAEWVIMTGEVPAN